MKGLNGLLALSALVLLVAVACGGGDEAAPAPTEAPPAAAATPSPTATPTSTPEATSTPAPVARPTERPQSASEIAEVLGSVAAPETPTADTNSGAGGGGGGGGTTPPSSSPSPRPRPANTGPDAVVSMRLPALGVDAPIEAIGLIPGRNTLDVPGPYTIGWYDIYDRPGTGRSSLYSAHKDYWPDIRGPFYALQDLQAGDEVVVVMGDGREYVYEVFFSRRYHVDDVPNYDLIFPHKARNPRLRRPPSEEWVTLYTCGGDFVERTAGGAGYYLHRDVVIAKLVRTNPAPAVRAATAATAE